MEQDPVCKMEVSPETAAAKLEHGGTTYYFCSTNCRDTFRREPERFVGGANGSGAGG